MASYHGNLYGYERDFTPDSTLYLSLYPTGNDGVDESRISEWFDKIIVFIAREERIDYFG